MFSQPVLLVPYRLSDRGWFGWTVVRPFRDKEEAGHEEPWYAYLRGDNPLCPEVMLAAAHARPGGGWC